MTCRHLSTSQWWFPEALSNKTHGNTLPPPSHARTISRPHSKKRIEFLENGLLFLSSETESHIAQASLEHTVQLGTAGLEPLILPLYFLSARVPGISHHTQLAKSFHSALKSWQAESMTRPTNVYKCVHLGRCYRIWYFMDRLVFFFFKFCIFSSGKQMMWISVCISEMIVKQKKPWVTKRGVRKGHILNYKGQGCSDKPFNFKSHSGSTRRGEQQESSQDVGWPEQ